MGLDDYFGLGKPDEKKQSEQQTNKFVDAFNEWEKFILSVKKPIFAGCWVIDFDFFDYLLQSSMTVLEPYEHALPESIEHEVFLVEKLEKGYKPYAGFFFTALLNVGSKNRKVTIPASYRDISFLGYGLKKGTLELFADGKNEIGFRAEGGRIINHGYNSWNICMATRDGVFINHGQPAYFGTCAKGGIFVNHGKLHTFGSVAQGGIFINHGKIDYGFGGDAEAGLLVNYGEANDTLLNKGLCIDAGKIHYGGECITSHHNWWLRWIDFFRLPARIPGDKILNDLIDALGIETKKNDLDPRKVQSLTAQIQKQCERYGKR